MELELQFISLDLAIAKLDEISDLEELLTTAEFVSITKTEDEISLVIDSKAVPDHLFANSGWNAFKIAGSLDFSLVGILNQVIQPLSENGTSIFTISTFDTDYVLVKKEQVAGAIETLKKKFKVTGLPN